MNFNIDYDAVNDAVMNVIMTVKIESSFKSLKNYINEYIDSGIDVENEYLINEKQIIKAAQEKRLFDEEASDLFALVLLNAIKQKEDLSDVIKDTEDVIDDMRNRYGNKICEILNEWNDIKLILYNYSLNV